MESEIWTNALVIAIAAVPLGPFAAFVLTVVGGRFLAGSRGMWVACIGAAVSCIAAAAAIALQMKAESAVRASGTTVELFRWLALPDDPASVVTLGLRLDGISGIVVVALMAAMVAACAHSAIFASARFERRSQAPAMAALIASAVMAFLAPSLVQFFIFWQLSAVCGWWLHAACADEADDRAGHASLPAASGDVIVHRTTDVFFLFGVLLLWVAFGTSDFAAIGGDSSSLGLAAFLDANGNVGLQGHRTAVVATICLCLLVGIVGRCQQFPLFGKLGDRTQPSPAIDGLVQAAIFVPLGVYLLARCRLLFASSLEVSRLTVMVGALTAVLAAACAMTERDLRRLLRFVAAAICGWMLMGLGSGTATGFLAALLLLVVSIFAMSALFLVAEQVAVRNMATEFTDLGGLRNSMPVQYWSFLFAALVLASGLWGQNAILAALAASTDPAIESVDASARVSAALPAFAAASLLLISLALFRGFLLTFHHGPQRANSAGDLWMAARPLDARTIPATTIVLLMALLAAVIGPAAASYAREFASLLGESAELADSARAGDLFFVDYGSLALTGAVVAWMMYAQPSEWPARIARALAPFASLSENRFYLEKIGAMLVVMPIQGLSYLCRAFDWLIIDRFWNSAPASLIAEVKRSTRPLQTGLVQFYALSLSLASVIFLAIVLWLKR